MNVDWSPTGAEYSSQTYAHPTYTSYSDAWRFTNSSILGKSKKQIVFECVSVLATLFAVDVLRNIL